MANLPSFQQLKNMSAGIVESGSIPEQGATFSMQKTLGPYMQTTYNFEFCHPNPYFGMQQGIPETKPSNWGLDGVVVGDINPTNQEPGLLLQFQSKPNVESLAKFKASEQNIMVRKSLGSGSLQWGMGFSPMENKMHLIRELTYSNTGEKLTWNLTAAGPELVSKKEGSNGKFQPQGVFEAGFVTKVTENQVFGASLMHRRQINPMMGGLTKAYDGSLTLIHTHENEVSLHPKVNGKFSDGNPTLTAEATTSVMLNTDGVMPKELVFEHVTRGGTKHSPCELVANLSIGKDPMPVQYGGTGGIKSTGFLGISQKIAANPKKTAKSPMQMAGGLPNTEEDIQVKAKITSDGVVTTIVEGKLAPLPIGFGMRVSYNMFKDSLKFGTNLAFSM